MGFYLAIKAVRAVKDRLQRFGPGRDCTKFGYFHNAHILQLGHIHFLSWRVRRFGDGGGLFVLPQQQGYSEAASQRQRGGQPGAG